jgi:hypothetical protein
MYVILFLREESLFDQLLCDLHCVCSSTFSEIVRYAPEIQSVFHRRVTADTSYKYVILAPCVQWHRVDIVRGVILKGDTRGFLHDPAYIFEGEILLEFEVDGL